MSDDYPVVIYSQDDPDYSRHMNIDQSDYARRAESLAGAGYVMVPDPEAFVSRAREGRPVSAPPEPPGRLATAGRSALNAVGVGWGDEIEGAARSVGDETYGEAVSDARRQRARGQEANPGSHALGTLAGIAPHVALLTGTGGGSAPVQAAGMARFIPMLLEGAGYGVASALGEGVYSPSERPGAGPGETESTTLPQAIVDMLTNPRQVGGDAFVGGLTGAGLNAGAAGLARGLGAGARAARGVAGDLVDWATENAAGRALSQSVGRNRAIVNALIERYRRGGERTYDEATEYVSNLFRQMGLTGPGARLTRPAVMHRRAQGISNETGGVIGSVVQHAEEAGARFDLQALEQQLIEALPPGTPPSVLDEYFTTLRQGAIPDPLTGQRSVPVSVIDEVRDSVGEQIGRTFQRGNQEAMPERLPVFNSVYSVLAPVRDRLVTESGAVARNRSEVQRALGRSVDDASPVAPRMPTPDPMNPPRPPGPRDTIREAVPPRDTIPQEAIHDTVRMPNPVPPSPPTPANTLISRDTLPNAPGMGTQIARDTLPNPVQAPVTGRGMADTLPVRDTLPNAPGAPTMPNRAFNDTMTGQDMARDLSLFRDLRERYHLSRLADRGLSGQRTGGWGQTLTGGRGIVLAAAGGLGALGGGAAGAATEGTLSGAISGATAGGLLGLGSRVYGPSASVTALEAISNLGRSRPAQTLAWLEGVLGRSRGRSLFQLVNNQVREGVDHTESAAADHFQRSHTDPGYRVGMQAVEDAFSDEHKLPGTYHNYHNGESE